MKQLQTKHWLQLAGGLVIVVAVAGFLLSGNGDDAAKRPAVEQPTPATSPEPSQEATQTPSDNQPAGPEPPTAPETAGESAGPTPEQDPTETEPVLESRQNSSRLPDNWDQLSLPQKTDLNPFDCPADENDVTHIDDKTGECLPAVITRQPESEDQNPQPPTNPKTDGYRIGQPFAASLGPLDLELTVNRFNCRRLDKVVLGLARNETAERIQNAFDRYRQNGSSLFFSGERDSLIKFAGAIAYLDSFRRHLGPSGPADTAGLWAKLSGYQECLASLGLVNTGDDFTFPDSCPPDLNSHFVAIDSNQNRHRPRYLGSGVACAKVETPYPTGDKTKTSVYFTTKAEVDIVTLVVGGDQAEISVED